MSSGLFAFGIAMLEDLNVLSSVSHAHLDPDERIHLRGIEPHHRALQRHPIR